MPRSRILPRIVVVERNYLLLVNFLLSFVLNFNLASKDMMYD